MKINIKLRVFGDRLFGSSPRVGEVGWADEEGGGWQHWVGEQQRGGGNSAGGGGQQWGRLQPKNRPSHHKYKSSKQFELKQS